MGNVSRKAETIKKQLKGKSRKKRTIKRYEVCFDWFINRMCTAKKQIEVLMINQ